MIGTQMVSRRGRIRYRPAESAASSHEIFRAYMKTVTANRSNER